MAKKCKLKRVVIKEELVALVGGSLKALILNQFLYWEQRVRDFDQFIQEEKERDPTVEMELTRGWIYKSSVELTEELMLDTSARTIRRRLEELVESGLLDRRDNPHYDWDKCWQYRPNLRLIQEKLQALGYALEGYPLLPQHEMQHEMSGHSVQSIGHGVQSNGQSDQSNGHSDQALPEITTEITTEITAERQPKLDLDFGTALKAYQDTFGPLGSSHLYDKFQMLWDEHPNLKTHRYARKEMYRAMMDDNRRVHPNLSYYAQCLATGAARAEGKRSERRNGGKRRNVPERTVVDFDDPDVQAWMAERSESETND